MSDGMAGDLLGLTAKIVAAHLARNQTSAADLPALITGIYSTLATVGTDPVAIAVQEPAVPVKKSVFPDYLVCLEDGKQLKMLKRHLMTTYGMTPDDYRAKWGLPASYPVVAPNYAKTRSALAKKIGLGRKPGERPQAKAEPEVTLVKARRARGSRG